MRTAIAGVVALLSVVAGSVAEAQSTTTVTAAWDRNTDALTTGYIVSYGTASGSYQWSHDAGNQVSTQLTLSRGALYYFTVRAYNASAQQGPASNEATIDLRTSTPAPTATLSASLQGGQTAVVAWQTSDAVSVTINGATVALSGTQSVPVSATTTFTLVARNVEGVTVTRSATVSVTAPAAPTGAISATLQNNASAVVTWQTTNAVSVTINGASAPLSGTQNVPISATTTFTLEARNAAGVTITRSATVTVTPPASGAPGAPTNMSTSATGSRVTFSWVAPAAGARPEGYLIDVGLQGSSRLLVAGYPVGNLTAVAADLPKGDYTTRVRATNTAGTSNYSNLVRFKVGRKLATPKSFTVRWIGDTAVLSWATSAADGSVEDVPTAYVLEAGTAAGLADIASLNVGNATSFSAPVPGGVYYVRLRALNDYGDSDPTPELVLIPPGAPGAPNTLVASRVNGMVNLRWNAPAGSSVTGYIVEAGSAPGLSDLAQVPVGTATTFSAPVPVGTYYVRVRGVNGRGTGLPSNEVVVR